MTGNGGFETSECISLLEQADVVVTNPPFSRFREYFAQLIKYDKKFLVLGRLTAFKSQKIFPLFQNHKVWFGVNSRSLSFEVPDNKPYDRVSKPDGKKLKVFGNVRWYTNLDHDRRHEDLKLYRYFDKTKYLTYDNYDAIEVSEISEIPQDYSGVMGVPISIMEKLNPRQFAILGKTNRDPKHPQKTKVYTASDSPRFNDLNASPIILEKDGQYVPKFERLLIQNLKPKETPSYVTESRR